MKYALAFITAISATSALPSGSGAAPKALRPWYPAAPCDKHTEECWGTQLWCEHFQSNTGRCFAERDSDSGLRLFLPTGRCSGVSEKCFGTETYCRSFTADPEACLAQRVKDDSNTVNSEAVEAEPAKSE